MISRRVCRDMRGASAAIGGAGVGEFDCVLDAGAESCLGGAELSLCPFTRMAGKRTAGTRRDAKRRRSIKHPRATSAYYNAARHREPYEIEHTRESRDGNYLARMLQAQNSSAAPPQIPTALHQVQRLLDGAALFLDFFLQQRNGVDELFGPRWATGDVDIHGNNLVHALHQRIVLKHAP
jgi:hypothetical protein